MISNLSLKISDVNLFKLILKWMFLCLPFYLWRYGKWSIRHAAHNMSHETVNQYSQFTNETLLIRKYLDINASSKMHLMLTEHLLNIIFCSDSYIHCVFHRIELGNFSALFGLDNI